MNGYPSFYPGIALVAPSPAWQKMYKIDSKESGDILSNICINISFQQISSLISIFPAFQKVFMAIGISVAVYLQYTVSPWLYASALQIVQFTHSKVHGANMGPTWGRQDPGGLHVGLMNLWVICIIVAMDSLYICHSFVIALR